MDAWTDGRMGMDGRIDGSMDGGMEGWMGGWRDNVCLLGFRDP